MATYTVTIPDAADTLMQQSAPSLGWDSTTTTFADFVEQEFIKYAAGVVAPIQASSAAQPHLDDAASARQSATNNTYTSFGISEPPQP